MWSYCRFCIFGDIVRLYCWSYLCFISMFSNCLSYRRFFIVGPNRWFNKTNWILWKLNCTFSTKLKAKNTTLSEQFKNQKKIEKSLKQRQHRIKRSLSCLDTDTSIKSGRVWSCKCYPIYFYNFIMILPSINVKQSPLSMDSVMCMYYMDLSYSFRAEVNKYISWIYL